MIDPSNITDYNLDDHGLQEILIFWICVAGKTASTIAKALDRMLNNLEGDNPFDKMKQVGFEKLPETLKGYGIGCYNLKAKAIWELVNSNIDLRTCTTEDLESIVGIGKKTSRCFIMHSRPDSACAGLDVHILKFLREKGHVVPKATPASKKQYEEVEKLFLKYAKRSGKPVAEFDLDIWKKHAYNGGRVKGENMDGYIEVTKEEIENAMLLPGEYKLVDGKYYIKPGMLDGYMDPILENLKEI